jgi:hypothetical protein
MTFAEAAQSAYQRARKEKRTVYVVFRPELLGNTSSHGFVTIGQDDPICPHVPAEVRADWRIAATVHSPTNATGLK